MKKRLSKKAANYLSGKSVIIHRSSSSGVFLKRTVTSTRWSAAQKTKLAEVRIATNTRYGAAFKELAQY